MCSFECCREGKYSKLALKYELKENIAWINSWSSKLYYKECPTLESCHNAISWLTVHAKMIHLIIKKNTYSFGFYGVLSTYDDLCPSYFPWWNYFPECYVQMSKMLNMNELYIAEELRPMIHSHAAQIYSNSLHSGSNLYHHQSLQDTNPPNEKA